MNTVMSQGAVPVWWWRAVRFGLLTALLVLVAAGCGGSANPADPGGSGGDPIPGTPVSPAARLASLTAVEARILDLAAGGPGFDPVGLLAFLAQQSVFAESGYSAAAACAWAVYTDGRVLIMANDPAAASGAPVGTAKAAGRPLRAKGSDSPLVTAAQWRSVEALSCVPSANYFHVTGGWIDDDTIPRLSRIAAGLGFAVVDPGQIIDDGYVRPFLADVEGLKTVAGDGVFLITALGGYAEAGEVTLSAIRTLTPALVGAELNLQYEEDLKARRLVYFMAPPCAVAEAGGPVTSLAITPAFARFYEWSFPAESVVYLNTTGGTLIDWLGPLQARGAAVVLGWSGGASLATMLGAAQDFFELLFATNNIGPLTTLQTEPRLRSYGIDQVYAYLWQEGLLNGIEHDGQAGSLELFQDYGPDGFVNQLRPTIQYLFVDESAGEMELVGEFGTTAGKVLIGSATNSLPADELLMVADPRLSSFDELAVVSWEPNTIRVTMPANRNLAGMVQVTLGTRFSNVAHLTRWEVPFQIHRTVGGSLHRTVSMTVAFRGFVSGYRISPDQPLHEQWPVMSASHMLEGDIGWSGSGALSQGGPGGSTTVAWSGAGNFNRSDGADEFFYLAGILRVPERRLECQLAMVVDSGLHVTTTVASPQGGSTSERDQVFSIFTPGAEFPSFGGLHLNFSADWVLQSGNQVFQDSDESVFGGEACQTQVTWGQISPEYPPENDRGGR